MMWNPQMIKFLIQGICKVLPSPSNLFSWGQWETPACSLLFRDRYPRAHPEQLLQGTERGRHDQVLQSTTEVISKGISDSWHTYAIAKRISRRGSKEQTQELLCWAAYHNVEAAETVDKSRWLWIKRVWAASVRLPGRGCLWQDPKHPMTPGYNTDDVSRSNFRLNKHHNTVFWLTKH